MNPHTEPSSEALESIQNTGGILGHTPAPKNALEDEISERSLGLPGNRGGKLTPAERLKIARESKVKREPVPPPEGEKADLGPGKAIRAFCLQCVGSSNEVRVCCSYSCALWSHRFGVRPASLRARKPELLSEAHVRELNSKRVTK